MNKQKIKIQRALLSVYDKTGIVELAESLNQHGVEIISTGGTAKILGDADLQVTNISIYTGFPEIMDGRIKTINPLVEGGILGLRDKHADEARTNNIKWIDLLKIHLKMNEDEDKDESLSNIFLENIYSSLFICPCYYYSCTL